jgi:integrase
MTDEVAGFASQLPERYRYAVVSALRQTCEAGVRYGYMTRNPAKLAGKNPQPAPRGVRVFTVDELKAITDELSPKNAAAVEFAAATGLRPSEWASIERRDVDKARRVLQVRGTKTIRSRREVPLTTAALAALESLPARIDSPFVFGPTRRHRDASGLLVAQPFDVHNFRRRKWGPAIEAAGVPRPARIYDLRSTFASNWLAKGVTTFELARIMGTSVGMIEHTTAR